MVFPLAICLLVLRATHSSAALIRAQPAALQRTNGSDEFVLEGSELQGNLKRAHPTRPTDFSSIHQVYSVNFRPVNPDDTRTMGSCYEWKDKILNGYVELLGILQAASRAMGTLEESYPEDPGLQRNYVQDAEAFQTFFGTLGGSTASQAAMREVKATYDAYIRAHQHDLHELVRVDPKYDLRCDDDFLDWYPPTQVDPRDYGTPDYKKYNIGNPKPGRTPYPFGAFFGTSLPPQKALLEGFWGEDDMKAFQKNPETRKNPICGDKKYRGETGGIAKAKAFVFYDNALLVFCPDALQEKHWSIHEVRKTLVERTDVRVFRDTLALCWAHELGHLIQDWYDPVAVDPNNKEVTDKKTGEKITLGDLDPARNLAYYDKKRTLTSPENYAWFATLVKTNWFWGTHEEFGRARMNQDTKDFNPETGTPRKKVAGDAAWWAQPQPESPKAPSGKLRKLKDKFIPKKPGQSSSKPNGRSISASDERLFDSTNDTRPAFDGDNDRG